MCDASVEPHQRFTDATCDRLTQIVLTIATLSGDCGIPQRWLDEFREALDADAACSKWQLRWAGDMDARAQLHALPQKLLEVRGWELGVSDPNPSHPNPSHPNPTDPCLGSAAAQRLLDTAALVVRHRSLETNFATALAAQKQQAIYNFAYGLSHELNNPLAIIATRAGVLAREESNPQRAALLGIIVDNAMRGSEMLADLMLVARPPALQRASVNVGEFVDSIATRARDWISTTNITVDVSHGFTGLLELDPIAMREALWALVRNGVESMLDGGLLRICTSAGTRRDHSEICAIEVLDEGVGLSPAALENCFDPYFSGREAGRGLGLGLSKAQRIVTLHHGVLTLTHRAGCGCLARIELPR